MKRILSFISILLLIILAGCFGGTSSKNFNNLINTANKKLELDSASRDDKIHYGEATAAVYFPVYFPLVLPEGFKYSSHNIENSDFEGSTGSLSISYKKGSNHITFMQGGTNYDESNVLEKQEINLGEDKPYAFYQKRASGNIYVGWLASDIDMANENYVYLFEMSGVSKDMAISIAKKSVVYE